MLDTNIETKRKCIGVSSSGNPCNAYALKDSEYCLFHESSLEEFRKENRIFGGRTRKYIKVDGQKIEIKNVDNVMDLINEVISNLRELDISVNQSRVLLSAAETAMKALEYKELTERVEKLEEEMKSERR